MGSTTTDIIAIAGGKPAPRGLTDGERLVTGELVYTGLTRTDVSVVAQRATFRGRAQRLAAGGFANMADVRRILGDASGRRRPACHIRRPRHLGGGEHRALRPLLRSRCR